MFASDNVCKLFNVVMSNQKKIKERKNVFAALLTQTRTYANSTCNENDFLE